MKRQLIVNAILNLLGTIWGVAVSFLLTPFLVRQLGDDGYGVWVLALSFSASSGYFAVLDFGFLTAVVKFIATYHARDDMAALNQAFSAALLLYSGLGSAAMLLIVLFARFLLEAVFNIPPSLLPVARSLLYVFAVRTGLEFVLMVLTAALQGLQRYDLVRVIEFVRLTLFVLLVVVLLRRGYGMLSLAHAALAVMVFQLWASLALLRRTLRSLRIKRFTRRVIGELVRFSAQVFVLRINLVIHSQMDKLIIGAYLISTLLTDYDIAGKVRALALALITSVTSLTVPAASYLEAHDDYPRLRALFQQGTKFALAVALPLVVAIVVLAPSLLAAWLGTEYSRLAGLVRLTVVYLVWFSSTMVGYNMLIGIGRVKALLMVQTVTTVVNLALSIWLTPRLGVEGVMWGTLVRTLLAFLPFMVLIGRAFDIRWGQFVRSVVVPVCAMTALFGAVLALAVWLWGQPENLWHLALLVGGSGALYAAGVFLVGVSAAERRMLLGTIRAKLVGS